MLDLIIINKLLLYHHGAASTLCCFVHQDQMLMATSHRGYRLAQQKDILSVLLGFNYSSCHKIGYTTKMGLN